MAINTLFLKATRLGPWSLRAIALAVLMQGGYLQIGENARAAPGVAGGIAGMTTFGFLSKIACTIGLIALVKVVLQSGDKNETAADFDNPDLPLQPEPVAHIVEVQPSPKTSAVPFAHSAAQDDEDLEYQTRRVFGLRKIMILVIGGAFAVIVGGVLFALFMIRFYFRLRRAMQPKTTAHIGGMGIN